MQICTSIQTDRQHLTTQFFTGRMPFLPPNQQRQSTEGKKLKLQNVKVTANDKVGRFFLGGDMV